MSTEKFLQEVVERLRELAGEKPSRLHRMIVVLLQSGAAVRYPASNNIDPEGTVRLARALLAEADAVEGAAPKAADSDGAGGAGVSFLTPLPPRPTVACSDKERARLWKKILSVKNEVICEKGTFLRHLQDMSDLPTKNLDFSVRVMNALNAVAISTVGVLTAMSSNQLRDRYGFSPKVIRDIQRVLADDGLTLSDGV